MNKLKNYEKEIEEIEKEDIEFSKKCYEESKKISNNKKKIRDGLLKQYKSFFENSPNIKEINVKEVEEEPIYLRGFGIKEILKLRVDSILTKRIDFSKNKNGEEIIKEEFLFNSVSYFDLRMLVNVINNYIEKQIKNSK